MRKSCIPNLFTFINLSCGIISILCTFDKNYLLACVFILVAGLVDRYDGRVARWLDVSSDLGKELDSLADLVSFGVAPSILVFILYNLREVGPGGIIGLVVLLTFPICGAFRLARYNATDFDGSFRGVPITIAGAFMALFVLLTLNFSISVWILIALMLSGSYLMVSTFEIKKL
ncbi:CDP-diacylglycerol--serine O-phosphatidyltransferase [Clostridium septicum]|uniref:CDP-diacylglycerol--serine O-phosphatidyltransferase n=1 Tax=Clostridium septicum TaxID=1504 RepID=A0A9N7JKH9_CLOSE|nr:CDP-diacylglycerol--serine O-phosphatidyltransferase [Clostridium septicum]AYE33710.1 CDP-diacylglycerol--serine O-phosphatidyltransferase [Clostridium septicum]MDU1313759.1 CDP-diacylglycerol--serine O-phosphatidyltransferase [Clostridium septicum]QAS61865.1 CDP-diacylglycerol--serine O-phosphatidyltransferase [Clostridium septicum]UEC21679.1 CDP-diacylglycerol--serine O-phosphatidyltransferase [Clostridium septicum]USS00269.1 CDP-diacylglycerol--serine O-phosphatidyltransferase [Clostridi